MRAKDWRKPDLDRLDPDRAAFLSFQRPLGRATRNASAGALRRVIADATSNRNRAAAWSSRSKATQGSIHSQAGAATVTSNRDESGAGSTETTMRLCKTSSDCAQRADQGVGDLTAEPASFTSGFGDRPRMSSMRVAGIDPVVGIDFRAKTGDRLAGRQALSHGEYSLIFAGNARRVRTRRTPWQNGSRDIPRVF